MHYQVFPTGQDSATFWDKGTEIPSLSKRTTRQAKNLDTEQDGRASTDYQNPGQDVGRGGTITIFFLSFPVLEHLFLF